MAKSASVKGFWYKKNLRPGADSPMRVQYLITNSEGPLTIGDAVQLTSGYITGAAGDEHILGILEGFVKNGQNIFQGNAPTISGTKSGDDTYTAASDNVTVDQVYAVVNIDPYALFEGQADSTLTAAEVGLWFNGVASSGTTVDEVTGTGAAYSAGTQQFQLMDLITTLEDGTAATSYGLFRIGRSQIAMDGTP